MQRPLFIKFGYYITPVLHRYLKKTGQVKVGQVRKVKRIIFALHDYLSYIIKSKKKLDVRNVQTKIHTSDECYFLPYGRSES